MGWKEEAVAESKTLFVQQILDSVGSHVEDTYDNIKSAIGSALEGKLCSDEEVKKVTAPITYTSMGKVFHYVVLRRGLL